MADMSFTNVKDAIAEACNNIFNNNSISTINSSFKIDGNLYTDNLIVGTTNFNDIPANGGVKTSTLANKIDLGELPTPIISAGGRKLYRHSSDMGTVMEFNDGQDRKVLVLDAQYRARALLMTSSRTDTSLPNYSQTNSNNNWYIHGTDSSTTPSACASLTDATLNSLWVNSIDANTSKYNTDVWLTMNGCDAATHCRSITVDGVGCDIPNIQTLMRIYCEAINLDALDPTVASYQNMKLSDWFGSWYLYSSSEYDTYYVRRVSCNGGCNEFNKGSVCGVCPVLEL